MTAIVITDVVDLEELTGMPGVRVRFTYSGSKDELIEWLKTANSSSQICNLEFHENGTMGVFVELNAWDMWSVGDSIKIPRVNCESSD